MASVPASSNKAKIAKRVVEVLEFFDDNHRQATVMDIVRRYDRPQSSTSELLSSLVDLGLLYKDPYSRSYSLTPRAALIGSSGQAGMVRDGSLVRLLDRLVAQTGLPVAVFGMVGLKTQIVAWRPGTRGPAQKVKGMAGGLQEPLCDNAAGWLLLSTVDPMRSDAILRRLNAEASEDRKFSTTEMSQRLSACRDSGKVRGQAGFNTRVEVTAQLLPVELTEHAIAVGFVHVSDDQVNPESLQDCLDEAIRQCAGDMYPSAPSIGIFASAA